MQEGGGAVLGKCIYTQWETARKWESCVNALIHYDSTATADGSTPPT